MFNRVFQVLQSLISFLYMWLNYRTPKRLPSQSSQRKRRTAWELNCSENRRHPLPRLQIQTCIAGNDHLESIVFLPTWTLSNTLWIPAQASTAPSPRTHWPSSWPPTSSQAQSISVSPLSPPPLFLLLPFSPSTWESSLLVLFCFGSTGLSSSFGSRRVLLHISGGIGAIYKICIQILYSCFVIQKLFLMNNPKKHLVLK